MKIGIDCRFWGIEHAGLGRYTREVVLAMIAQCKDSGFRIQNSELDLVLFFQKGKWKADEKKLKGCKIVEVDIPHYSLKEQLQFGKVVDREQLDLMHYMHFNVPMLAKTPFVVTIHDLIKHFFKGKPVTTRNTLVYWAKYGAYRLTIAQAIKKAQHIIVPSYFVKDQIASEYPGYDRKVKVIYEGVSGPYVKISNSKFIISKKIPNTKYQIPKIAKKYGIKNPYFVYTGSAYPSKDVATLLQTMKKLVGNRQACYLLIACARSHFWEKLQADVKKLALEKVVALPGKVPDENLIQLYQQAAAFVTASMMEGFGLPGLEAMASGCPVIASEAGSLPEIYEDGAIYFDPGNSDELAEKMQEMIKINDHEREQMIHKGIERSLQFRWEKSAVETLGVYEKYFEK